MTLLKDLDMIIFIVHFKIDCIGVRMFEFLLRTANGIKPGIIESTDMGYLIDCSES